MLRKPHEHLTSAIEHDETQVNRQDLMLKPFEKILPEILKIIFSYIPKNNLHCISQVNHLWHRIITQEYSSSTYGKMLRFAPYAMKPIEEIIEKLKQLQKELHHSVMSYTRSHPRTWVF